MFVKNWIPCEDLSLTSQPKHFSLDLKSIGKTVSLCPDLSSAISFFISNNI